MVISWWVTLWYNSQSFRHNGSHFVTRFQKGPRQKQTSNLDSRKSLIKWEIWIMVSYFGTWGRHFVINWVISSQGFRRALGKNGLAEKLNKRRYLDNGVTLWYTRQSFCHKWSHFVTNEVILSQPHPDLQLINLFLNSCYILSTD